MNKVIISVDRCKGCCLCVDTCPKHVIQGGEALNAAGYYYVGIVDQEACTACGLCASVCPDAAIAVYREVRDRAQIA